jgi:FMN-dependent dehydrogenase
MKIILKGILAQEDAKLAADYGIDGIIVSNHSGRVVDSGRATIEILPEIIEAVGGRMPVARRQRLSSRHRYYQSFSDGRPGRMCWTTLPLGPRCFRSGGCRARR